MDRKGNVVFENTAALEEDILKTPRNKFFRITFKDPDKTQSVEILIDNTQLGNYHVITTKEDGKKQTFRQDADANVTEIIDEHDNGTNTFRFKPGGMDVIVQQGDKVQTIDGNKNEEINLDKTVQIHRNQTETVDGDKNINVGGAYTINVTGKVTLNAQDEVDINAAKKITIDSTAENTEVQGNQFKSVSTGSIDPFLSTQHIEGYNRVRHGGGT